MTAPAQHHLETGQEVNLTQHDRALKRVIVGLGWDVVSTQDEYGNGDKTQKTFDLDASAFLLNAKRMIRSETDFVFYNNHESEEGAVKHSGDNGTGEGAADDEQIAIQLDKVPFDVVYIPFVVSIHNAQERQQDFGTVKNAYIRVINADTGDELVRHDLTTDHSGENALVIGELYRIGSEWVFVAKDEGFKGGLAQIARQFDVNIRGE